MPHNVWDTQNVWPRSVGAVALSAILITACGDPRPDGGSGIPAEGPATTVSPSTIVIPDSASGEASIALRPLNDTGVRAVATIVHREDIVVVVIEATGLPDPGEYPAHLYGGTCDDVAAEALTLDPVIGLADGTGESMTTLATEEIPPAGPFVIQVHGPGSAPMACGSLPPMWPRDSNR